MGRALCRHPCERAFHRVYSPFITVCRAGKASRPHFIPPLAGLQRPASALMWDGLPYQRFFQYEEDRVTEEVPFYQDGLYFSCQQGCAACCKIPGRVEIDEQDIGRMAEALGMTHNRFAATYVRKVSGQLLLRERDDAACVMLGEDDRCMVHAVRPLQCRTYPFWDEVLANDFTWILEKDLCPGLDKGRWFSREEIDALRRGQAQTGGFNEGAEG